MKTWSLAIRNLLRNRRRSLATVLALAIGCASILFFGGFSANIRETMLSGYVRAGGHLQVQHRDFFLYGNGNPVAYSIGDYERLVEAIRKDPMLQNMVTVVTPMLQFGGIAGNYDAGVSRTVVGTGFVAEDINRMRQWNESGVPMASPRFVLEGAPNDSAVLGIGVARVLLLCDALKISDCPRPEDQAQAPTGRSLPSDVAALAADELKAAPKAAAGAKPRIELLAGQGKGTPNVATLQVIAAEDQGFKELDEVSVVLHLKQAQKLVFGRGKPKATALVVQLQRTEQMQDATERLMKLVSDVMPGQALTVKTFVDLNPFYVQTLDLFRMIFSFIFVLIGGIVLFTVSNTMTAAVVERTVEIGTLRAVGLRQSGVRRLFVMEGLTLGCVGAIAGTTFAVLVSLLINLLNLKWLPPGSSEQLPLTIRILSERPMILGTFLGLIAVATVSAWWPARLASRLRIVDALRHA